MNWVALLIVMTLHNGDVTPLKVELYASPQACVDRADELMNLMDRRQRVGSALRCIDTGIKVRDEDKS